MAVFNYIVSPTVGKPLLTQDDTDIWVSETITNPSTHEYFWAFIDPGHAGTATEIGYGYYQTSGWQCLVGTPATLSFNFDIKPSGGAWTTIGTGSAYLAGAGEVLGVLSGVYSGTILMPCEFRLTGTDADAQWSLRGITVGSIVLSFVGTVT